MMRRTLRRSCLAVGIVLLLSGCATFQLTHEPFHPKGKKLAVIAGLTNPGSLHAAQALADELAKSSRFQITPLKQVAQSIPNYPQLVKGPYHSAYFEIDVDYGKTDLARVRELQHRLGVDYLYVLWAPATVSHGSGGLFFKNYPLMQVVAQLFETPDSREVGRGQYAVRVEEKTHEILRDDMQRVAKELAEKTSTLK
ncbi:MAG: hypothetical protein BVN28_10150 [Nitrospira sp. ST-bin4]|jgi:hypothetical protein|nr:MAG: hypothetical protein BVN28_10150 [Nitrospira sp. ST-bin4]